MSSGQVLRFARFCLFEQPQGFPTTGSSSGSSPVGDRPTSTLVAAVESEGMIDFRCENDRALFGGARSGRELSVASLPFCSGIERQQRMTGNVMRQPRGHGDSTLMNAGPSTANAFAAFDALGIGEKARGRAVYTDEMVMHDALDETLVQPLPDAMSFAEGATLGILRGRFGV